MITRGALSVVAVLALLQAGLCVLRALQWFEVGSDLGRSGVLLLPIISVVAVARGVLVGGLAVLYLLFAWGTFAGKGWAPAVGLAACAVNAVAVLALVVSGSSPVAALPWLIAPVIIGAVLLRWPARRAIAG
jgi:hypothetical protein